ncbi:MAG TPA: acyl-CoA thioesterase [Gemmatimonadota bacterium]|nr:acyl-CoA thioesterase [Gemmatimonadota bacterium]
MGVDPEAAPVPRGKPVSASHVTISLLAAPETRNIFGSVHGGWIMRQVDETAYVCAARHAGRHAITASIDRVDFKSPIHVGDLVRLKASVHWVGRTSMLIGVKVEAEDLLSGEVRHTNSCLLTFVAIDESFKPVPVPGLIRETPEEEERWRAAVEKRRKKG